MAHSLKDELEGLYKSYMKGLQESESSARWFSERSERLLSEIKAAIEQSRNENVQQIARLENESLRFEREKNEQIERLKKEEQKAQREQERIFDQIQKQLEKLIEIIEVKNLSKEGKFVDRWLLLMKINAPLDMRPHILQTAQVFRCRVVDLGTDAITIEVTGDMGKIDACKEAFRPYGIIETAGSGQIAMSRSGFHEDNVATGF